MQTKARKQNQPVDVTVKFGFPSLTVGVKVPAVGGFKPDANPLATAAKGTFCEFTEEQLIAFDCAYAAAKDTGALDRVRVVAAVNFELSHNRIARLA